MNSNKNITSLAKGNSALRNRDYCVAIKHYIRSLLKTPDLAEVISANISLTRKKYRHSRNSAEQKRVAVCGWELAHNAAGRVYTLAQIYQTFADVEIIGSIFPSYGREVWEPIRSTAIPKHTFVVDDQSSFLEQAIELVAVHPYDIVHLSKPRAPNIFFGILYKLIWDAKVLMDIDDEELAFVGAKTSINLEDYLNQHGTLPQMEDLQGMLWTQLAVGLVSAFDGITVSNPALQQRYGGEIIRHARDQKLYQPSPDLTSKSRSTFSIPLDKKVILFFGTPREHKGLLEIATSIASLNRDDVMFVIVGDFPEPILKRHLLEIQGVDYRFISNQPFDSIPDVLAIGDICVLLLDEKSSVSQFQVPAKLSDALGMGLVVITPDSPTFSEFIVEGSVIPIKKSLSSIIISVLSDADLASKVRQAALNFFQIELTISRNSLKLRDFLIGVDKIAGDYGQLISILPLPLLQSFMSSADMRLVDKKKAIDITSMISIANQELPAGYIRKLETRDLELKIKKNKLPVTALVISWDVGHNPLGRSYMLAEVINRTVRNTVLAGFQFPRFGKSIWPPLRNSDLPIISIMGENFPEFIELAEHIARTVKPDVVFACKARLPSLQLGMRIRDITGCPLILDIDDHELSFFKNKAPISLEALEAMPFGSLKNEQEPFEQTWTRVSEGLVDNADQIIVSNSSLQKKFGGVIVPHVRDEKTFHLGLVDVRWETRNQLDIPKSAKVVMFFGTPRLHKGVQKLAQAVSEIDDPDFYFVVVGTPPDLSVTKHLKKIVGNKLIMVPDQSFSDIPKVIACADVVALPQDVNHPISLYQLPAKAIDAIAMGVPLLVSETAPLMDLVQDGVATLIDKGQLASCIEKSVNAPSSSQSASSIRATFIKKYSYSAASNLLRSVIENSLRARKKSTNTVSERLLKAEHHVLGLPKQITVAKVATGQDVVVFWKQNDTMLYGRRHDMVIKYLESRKDIRKIIVFDAPISEHDLNLFKNNADKQTQHRNIYILTQEKLLGIRDTKKVKYRVFAHKPGIYSLPGKKQKKLEPIEPEFIKFVESELAKEGVEATKSIFWLYPKNFFIQSLLEGLKPAHVVVDVVDDHRAWPGVSSAEKQRLTEHYRDVLQNADTAFANCKPVQESMSEYFPEIQLIPNGCDESPPTAEPGESELYKRFTAWNGKIIGFVGNLEPKIDINLLKRLAIELPDCLIALLGSTHANPNVRKLDRFDNVMMPGVVHYQEVGAWLKRFNVALIPHIPIVMTEQMNPLKLFVYAAHGIPVVATNVANLDINWQGLSICSDSDAFVSKVQELLSQDKAIEGNTEYVKQNSWSKRLEATVTKIISSL